MSAILWIVVGVVVPFVVSLVACELHGASPHFARRVTRLIAKALPAEVRETMEDQWYDDLRLRQERGLRLWLFFVAFGFLFSTVKIQLDHLREYDPVVRRGLYFILTAPLNIGFAAAGMIAGINRGIALEEAIGAFVLFLSIVATILWAFLLRVTVRSRGQKTPHPAADGD